MVGETESRSRARTLHRRLAPWSIGLAAIAGSAALLGLSPFGFLRSWFGWVALAVVGLCGLLLPILTTRWSGRVLTSLRQAWLESLGLAAHALPLLAVASYPGAGATTRVLAVAAVTALAAMITAAVALAAETLIGGGLARPVAGVLVALVWVTPLVPTPWPWEEARSVWMVLPAPDPTRPSVLGCLGASLAPPTSTSEVTEWMAAASPLQQLAEAVPAAPADPAAAAGRAERPDRSAGWFSGGGTEEASSTMTVSAPGVAQLAPFRARSGLDFACDSGTVPAWPRGVLLDLLLLAVAVALTFVVRARAGRADPAGPGGGGGVAG